MRAKFIGDPRDDFSGPEHITTHGLTFRKGEFREVADPAVFAKLSRHSHFETAGEAPAPIIQSATTTTVDPPETAAPKPPKNRGGRPRKNKPNGEAVAVQ